MTKTKADFERSIINIIQADKAKADAGEALYKVAAAIATANGSDTPTVLADIVRRAKAASAGLADSPVLFPKDDAPFAPDPLTAERAADIIFDFNKAEDAKVEAALAAEKAAATKAEAKGEAMFTAIAEYEVEVTANVRTVADIKADLLTAAPLNGTVPGATKIAALREELAAAEAREGPKPVEVGDVFSASWGYDQTNVDFYEVVGITPSGKSVRLRAIGSHVANSREYPNPGAYITTGRSSKPLTRRIKVGWKGEPYVNISDYAGGSRYDLEADTGEYSTRASGGAGH